MDPLSELISHMRRRSYYGYTVKGHCASDDKLRHGYSVDKLGHVHSAECSGALERRHIAIRSLGRHIQRWTLGSQGRVGRIFCCLSGPPSTLPIECPPVNLSTEWPDPSYATERSDLFELVYRVSTSYFVDRVTDRPSCNVSTFWPLQNIQLNDHVPVCPLSDRRHIAGRSLARHIHTFRDGHSVDKLK